MTLRGGFWWGTAILATLVAFAACVALWPREAKAQDAWLSMVCAPDKVIPEALEEHRGERKTAQGVTDRNEVFIRFTNPKTGSWTMVLVSPDESCAVLSGTEWDVFEPVKPQKPSH